MRPVFRSLPILALAGVAGAVVADAVVDGVGELWHPVGNGLLAGAAAWAGGRVGQRRRGPPE